jgi:hypothetical protein
LLCARSAFEENRRSRQRRVGHERPVVASSGQKAENIPCRDRPRPKLGNANGAGRAGAVNRLSSAVAQKDRGSGTDAICFGLSTTTMVPT